MAGKIVINVFSQQNTFPFDRYLIIELAGQGFSEQKKKKHYICIL